MKRETKEMKNIDRRIGSVKSLARSYVKDYHVSFNYALDIATRVVSGEFSLVEGSRVCQHYSEQD